MKSFIFRSLATSAIAIAAAVPAIAQTQAADASKDSGIDEIIVTARRVSESLQTTPVAVTAITAQGLVNAQITTVDQLQSIAPGLVIQPAVAQPGSAAFALRGQSAPDGLIAVDQSVGAYVDGVYVARSSGGLFNLIDIERVEVLRGPQGTLFGRNTTGGAVNVINRKPTSDLEGMLGVGIGNYSAKRLTGVINLPMGSGIAARAIYQHSDHNGYGRNAQFNQSVGSDNTDFVRGIIGFEPDGLDIRAYLEADYTNRKTGGELIGLKSVTATGTNGALVGICSGPTARTTCPAVGPAGDTLASYAWDGGRKSGDFWTVYNSMSGIYGNAKTWGGSGTLEWDVSDAVAVKSISAWRGVNTASLSDNDGTPYVLTGGLAAVDGNFISQDQFTQELQLSGKAFGGNLEYIAGLFYFVENGLDKSKSYSVFPLSAALGYNEANVRNESQAAYAQATYHLAENLRFTGGLRFTKDIRSIVRRNRSENPGNSGTFTCSMDPTTLDAAGVCAATARKTFDYVSYTAGFDWKPADGTFLYLKSSKANRAGGFNTRAVTGGSAVSFDPESVTDYEAGGKFDFLDRTVRLNIAAFYSDYKNIQRNVPVVTPSGTLTSGNQNVAKGNVKGLETELTLAPTEGLTLAGAMTLLDAEYSSFTIPVTRAGALIQLDVSSTPFIYTPKMSYTLSANYVIPVGSGDLTLHGDYAYRSSSWAVGPLVGAGLFADTNRGTNRISGYGVFNGRIAYTLEKPNVEIAVYGRNLANKEYYQRLLALQDTALGTTSYLPGDPRTFGLSLTYKFGGY